ncbi:ran-binding protein 3-like isoform X1, partial [Dinothrombium tinctorium]
MADSNNAVAIETNASIKNERKNEKFELKDRCNEMRAERVYGESETTGDGEVAVQREASSNDNRFRVEAANSYSKGERKVSSSEASVDVKSKVTLRPSVLRVGKSDSSSVPFEAENKTEASKIFKFTPLTNSLALSSAEKSLIEAKTGCRQNGSSDEPSTSTAISGSLFTTLSQNSTVSSVSSSNANSATSEPSFVFGQNLQDRVLLPDSSEESNDVEKAGTESESGEKPTNCPEKRKFEAITGEEGESNVLQIYCKLYSWESAGSMWKERGKGFLRLNDKIKEDKLCSRLVMRTSGSLKVILNSFIVAGMKFELSNEQCLRFTNVDGIYLIK